ncbi:MAG: hypothetical protein J3R72DRAFT_530360 [Linnemannia gamsii]|nr:MAG: hypothetical protein J3R72DRAFT_530360 [Linnemannia gamsii]
MSMRSNSTFGLTSAQTSTPGTLSTNSSEVSWLMLSTLVGGDEKASFFTNLYRIQLQHSIRALNSFAEKRTKKTFCSSTLTQIFVLLITHFIFELDESIHVETEKILVHTVIAILDDFHFDIKDVEVSSEEALFIKTRMLILIIKNLNLSTQMC